MDTPVIRTPEPFGAVYHLADFLELSGQWHSKHSQPETGMLSNLWYRGVNVRFDHQAPGVYREGFTKRANQFKNNEDLEDKRLRLEREMISNFRTAGAAFHSKYSLTEMYFSAQHFGMPTRLLDRSTNPLAALFFACDGAESQDGFVYAMDARKVIPENAKKANGDKLWQSVVLMHNSIVRYAVEVSFWMP